MKCKVCKKNMVGRSDKIFCSIYCKNYYHSQLSKVTKSASQSIDKILHRNRSILLEILGKSKEQIKVERMILEKKKFNFRYHTHSYVNAKNKTYHYVYDIAWVEFSDEEVLLVRTGLKKM